jgi:hypothetical protein
MIFRFVPHASLLAALVASVALEPGAAHAQVRSARGRDTAVPGPTSLSIPTDPRTGRSVATGRVLVRVKPEYSITAPRGGEDGALVSRSGMDVSALSDALDALGASYGSMVDLTPAQTAELRQRAQTRSGRWSRDLSDWIVVQCRGDLLSTATYLQGLDLIDHVEIEARVNQSAPQCPSPPGECNAVNNAACPGPATVPNAATAQNAGGTNDDSIEGCSALVLEWLPTCIGAPPCSPGVAVWDWGCVTMANFLCTPSSYSPNGGPWRTCGDPSGGSPPGAPGTGNGSWSTFTAGHLLHAQLQSAGALNGSREPLCCDVVCAVNYLCCTISWDADCAASALTIPDCFITRDYLADLNAVADPLSPDEVSIYDLNPGTAGFDQGNPYQPTENDTPYFGDSNLLLGQTFNPGPGAAEFPLAAPATIAQPALSPGLDGVQGQVAIGSMPLALWGTRLRQLPPPNDPSNTDFFPFMRTTTFLGGGLDVGYMDFLSNALFGQSELNGAGIRVGVVDLSIYINHEEFLKADGTSKILVESGQSPFLLPPTPVPCDCGGFEASAEDCCTRCGTITTNSADCVDLSNPTYPPDGFVVYPQHGTAVMSVLVANRDTKGVTGLCPDAQPWFFPALTPTGQNRTAAALAGAAFALTAEPSSPTDPTDSLGNVCVVPLETAEGFQPLNSVNPDNDGQGQAIRDVISQGTDAGLTWVMSAGNGARIVNPAQVRDPKTPGSPDTTSVVVVGGVWPGFQLRLPQDDLLPEVPTVVTPAGPSHLPAIWPGNDYCRVGMSNFLNPEQEEGTDNLTISGWASGVCAAGYGDLFLGNDAKASYTGPALPGQSGNLRRYTANFGGTSAAAAMIGGAAVLLQEFSKLNYEGVPIPPVQVRNVLRGQAPGQGTSSSIFPQCGQVTPPTASENPVFGDTGSADTELARVIGFPNLRFMALDVSTGSWFDPESAGQDPPVRVTGKDLNDWKANFVSAVDYIYIKARSTRARGSESGSGAFGPSIPYALPNRVVDVQVNAGIDASADEVIKLNVEGNTTIFGSGLTLAMVFVYNNETSRWEFWLPANNQIQVLQGGVATGWIVQSPGCSPASAYVVPGSGGSKVYARVVTMAGGNGANYQCWHDQFRIVINGTGNQYTVGGCGALVP